MPQKRRHLPGELGPILALEERPLLIRERLGGGRDGRLHQDREEVVVHATQAETGRARPLGFAPSHRVQVARLGREEPFSAVVEGRALRHDISGRDLEGLEVKTRDLRHDVVRGRDVARTSNFILTGAGVAEGLVALTSRLFELAKTEQALRAPRQPLHALVSAEPLVGEEGVSDLHQRLESFQAVVEHRELKPGVAEIRGLGMRPLEAFVAMYGFLVLAESKMRQGSVVEARRDERGVGKRREEPVVMRQRVLVAPGFDGVAASFEELAIGDGLAIFTRLDQETARRDRVLVGEGSGRHGRAPGTACRERRRQERQKRAREKTTRGRRKSGRFGDSRAHHERGGSVTRSVTRYGERNTVTRNTLGSDGLAREVLPHFFNNFSTAPAGTPPANGQCVMNVAQPQTPDTGLHLAQLEPTEWTDVQLLSSLLVRSDRAWREFHRRFDRLVYKCIHKVTRRFGGVVAEVDVEDIYGQFLLNLTARDMHRLRAFQPERGNKLSTWIGLLATNTAWDHLRRLSRRPRENELDDARHIPAETAHPLDALEQRQRWALVEQALERFSDRDRTFVQLFYVEGLAAERVAQSMNISVKTVYSKKHKICTRLTAALRPHAA